VLKPGGHMVVLVPEEDMYEQGVWPSKKNGDHKWTFTMQKAKSWSPRTLNMTTLMTWLTADAELIKLEKLDATFRFGLPAFDQTLTPIGECAIELVLRKRPPEELEAGGRLPPSPTPYNIALVHALKGSLK